MAIAPSLTHSDDYNWEHIPGEEGRSKAIRWKTFAGSGQTTGISFGIFEVPPGAKLSAHKHPEHEIYYVTAGEGEVLIDDKIKRVKPGSILYVPANAEHGVRNNSESTLSLIWIFPVDRWYDIEYTMLERDF